MARNRFRKIAWRRQICELSVLIIDARVKQIELIRIAETTRFYFITEGHDSNSHRHTTFTKGMQTKTIQCLCSAKKDGNSVADNGEDHPVATDVFFKRKFRAIACFGDKLETQKVVTETFSILKIKLQWFTAARSLEIAWSTVIIPWIQFVNDLGT